MPYSNKVCSCLKKKHSFAQNVFLHFSVLTLRYFNLRFNRKHLEIDDPFKNKEEEENIGDLVNKQVKENTAFIQRVQCSPF